MNQLNEEIRIIQTQITKLEQQLCNQNKLMTGEQVKAKKEIIHGLHEELNRRLKQTKEVPL